MIDLTILVVLALAAFRITRFLLFDTLIDGIRNRFYAFLVSQSRFSLGSRLKNKLFELTSCSWCLGFWVVLVLYSIYLGEYPTEFTRFEWINVFAITGAQGMLHAYEPGDE